MKSRVEKRGVQMLPMFFRGIFLFLRRCAPSNKSRRLGVHSGHWWAQGCICGLAWGFVSHNNILYSFAPQPLALRISLYKQQKHRRVFIKASVGLACGASGTMSNICSRSTWHPSLPRGSHLELFFVVFTRSSRIFKLHFSRRVAHVLKLMPLRSNERFLHH